MRKPRRAPRPSPPPSPSSLCPGCGSRETVDDFVTNDVICVDCGLVRGIAFAVEDAKRFGHRVGYVVCKRGSDVVYKYTEYNPIFYSSELLRAWNAEDPPVSDTFVAVVAQALAEQGVRDPGLASERRIRGACQKLLRRDRAERWWQIKLRVCGYDHPCPVPDWALLELKVLFAIYVSAALQAKRAGHWGSRSSLQNYRYVRGQHLRMIDYWHGTDLFRLHRWYHPQLKTSHKVRDNDRMFRKVVGIVNERVASQSHPDPSDVRNRPWPFLPMAPLLFEP